MEIKELHNPIVRAALTAVNNNDRATWLSLFSPNAHVTDDGNPRHYVEWADTELFGKGNGRITNVEHEDASGLTIHTMFHSNVWGQFKTFWTFTLRDDKITRLDVGQLGA